MARYIVRRLLVIPPLLLGISLLAFVIIQLAPGDYLSTLSLNPQISPTLIQEMRKQFGLDQPAWKQYLKWLWNVAAHLNFGYSFEFKVPILDLIAQRLWNTLILSLSAMVLSWGIAIPIGTYAATRVYSLQDRSLTFLAYLGIAIPSFFLALLLLYLAATLKGKGVNLPIGGMQSPEFLYLSPWEKMVDLIHHLLLPTLVLGIGGVAYLMRQMRANLLETLRADFMTTARAKGLPERTVVWKHGVRNAINPLITLFGFELGSLLSGALMVEIVMAWPGLGRLMYEALLRKDLYLIMGDLVIGSLLLIIGNLISDILLAMSDPRIRYG